MYYTHKEKQKLDGVILNKANSFLCSDDVVVHFSFLVAESAI